MPKQINSPGPGSALVRQYNLKGRFQPVLDEVLVPVVVVDSLSQQPASYRYGLAVTAGASGAGNQNRVALRNPVGSTALIILRQLWAEAAAGTTDVVQLNLEQYGSTAAGNTGVALDARSLPAVSQGGTTSFPLAAAVSVGPRWTFGDAAARKEVWTPDVVLAPGFHLIIKQGAQNASIAVNLVWDEVPLPGSA